MTTVFWVFFFFFFIVVLQKLLNFSNIPPLLLWNTPSELSKRLSHRLNYSVSLPNNIILNFPGGSVGKEFSYNAGNPGDVGLIPGSGETTGGGNSNPLQDSCLENPMDRGTWHNTNKELDMTKHMHALSF